MDWGVQSPGRRPTAPRLPCHPLAGVILCSDLLNLPKASSGRTAATSCCHRDCHPGLGMSQASSRNALGQAQAETVENKVTWSLRHVGQGPGLDQGKATNNMYPEQKDPTWTPGPGRAAPCLGHTVAAQAPHTEIRWGTRADMDCSCPLARDVPHRYTGVGLMCTIAWRAIPWDRLMWMQRETST